MTGQDRSNFSLKWVLCCCDLHQNWWKTWSWKWSILETTRKQFNFPEFFTTDFLYPLTSLLFPPHSSPLPRNDLLRKEAIWDVSTIYNSQSCRKSCEVDIVHLTKPEEHFTICVDLKVSFCANCSVKAKYFVYSEDKRILSVDTQLATGFMWTNNLVRIKIKNTKIGRILWLFPSRVI